MKNSTPYEAWTGKKPNLSHTRIFGSTAYAHIPKIQRKKLDPKSRKLIVVDYEKDSTNYRLYDPRSRQISVCRDVTFNEETSVSDDCNRSENTKAAIPLWMIDVDDTTGNQTISDNSDTCTNDEDTSQQEENTKENKTLRRFRDRDTIRPPIRFEANFAEHNKPATYREAISDSHKKEWKEAIREHTKQMAHGK